MIGAKNDKHAEKKHSANKDECHVDADTINGSDAVDIRNPGKREIRCWRTTPY